MAGIIRQTIFDDKLRVYNLYREVYADVLNELDKEALKLQKKKKLSSEKTRLKKRINIKRLQVICRILKLTFLHY